MKKKPVLFNGEMVRAVLDGRKTQTRRPFKIQPCSSWKLARILDDGRAVFDVVQGSIPAAGVEFVKSPFGAPGDLLWVRETWATHPLNAKAARTKPSLLPTDTKVYYRADENENHFVWRPSIHMPRWASRLTLRVKKVLVQRVQDISESDARAEGCDFDDEIEPPEHEIEENRPFARNEFMYLWDRIYAKRGYPWESNCWVWVCEFEVAK